MSELDKNKKVRGTLRASITKLIRKIDEEISAENPNVDNLQESLAVLSEREDKLNKLDDVITSLTPAAEIESDFEHSLEYNEQIIRCKSRLNRLIKSDKHTEEIKADSSSAKLSEPKSNCHTKLPRISIEKFNGDISKFQEFWPQYLTAIHENDNLKDIEKFNYLKTLLTDSAAKAINGLTLTESNYGKAINILKDRFGKREILINTHMNILLSLEPVRRSNDVLALRKLHDEINCQIRSLETLSVDFNTYGTLLLPILYKCIPNDLVLQFNRLNSDNDACVTGLLEFIKKEIEAREKSLSVNFNQAEIPRYEKKNVESYKTNKKVFSAATLHTNSEKTVCDFCCQPHSSKLCKLTIAERYKALYDQYKCQRCFLKNHKKRFCKAKWVKCIFCNNDVSHRQELCPLSENKQKNNGNHAAETSVSSLFPENSNNESPKNCIYYQTLRAQMINNQCAFDVRIICDSGSQRSYILRDMSEKAKLQTAGTEKLKLFTFASKNPSISEMKRKKIHLKDYNSDKCLNLEVLETDTICSSEIRAPSPKIIKLLKKKGFILSDQSPEILGSSPNLPLSILIGNDYLNCILTGKTFRLSDTLVLYESIFGWTLCGPNNYIIESNSHLVNTPHLFIKATEEDNLSDQLRAMWEIEHLGLINFEADAKGRGDKQIIERFEKELRLRDKRYETRLLWKREPEDLPDNFELALRHLNRMRKELGNNQIIKDRVNEIINYQTENNIIRDSNEKRGGYIMPWKIVIKKDKVTSNHRMVFNCSSHLKGNLSLNDFLEQGPNLNPSVLDIILKFRLFKIAFSGDIEKAFLMIEIREEDREYLKFLWFADDELESFKVMQMNRVVFGCNCSPFLLSATIKTHLKKYSETNKNCVEMLSNALYADDLCYGADSIESAFNLSAEAVSILSDASFNLRKLNTNSKELHDLWVENGLCEEGSFEQDSKLKVLGLVWNLEQDVLRVDVTALLNSFEFLHNTKRSVLSTAARVFDPVGFISPFVVRIKKLMQEIWERGLEWDAELPGDLESKWKKWCAEVKEIGEVKISRCYFQEYSNENNSVEVHIFCDASIIAYGAVAYIRCEKSDGIVTTSFVMSKSRIAPLKRLSLPRLELMGALVAARLWKYLSGVFQGLVDRVFLWTDSEICLCWIKGSAREWKQFVSNRVLEIQDCVSPDRWNFCRGLENPADKLTRGESSHTLRNDEIWWFGPPWLKCSIDQWPQQKFKAVADDKILERMATSSLAIITQSDKIIEENKFSNYGRLLRVTALVKRFIDKLRNKSSEKGPLTVIEIQEAEQYWIKRVQNENYYSEIALLEQNKPVSPQSKLYNLVPYIDSSGILRVKGRLQQAELSDDQKNPIIIPKSKIAELIVMHEHIKTFHSGVTSTLSRIRNKFWIPKGRQIVKKVIGNCLICKKYVLKPAKQLTGQLPRDRVIQNPPFTVVGTDFTGAITVRAEAGTYKKVYIALFTCAVTRAVHIEVVSDMSTKSFIFALRRFLARRGNSKVFYSDNAKSFRSSCEIIKGFKKIIVDQSVREFITNENITWKFIPERSPWWGGFWERLMKSIKEPLKKILGKALLSLEELETILTEIECVLNNRPLTYDMNNVSEPRPLTPSDFLLPGHVSYSFPEHFIEVFNKVSDKETLSRRKLFQSKLLKQLWTKWKEQYLLQLRNAHNFVNPSVERSLKQGDVVLIEGPQKNKLLWEMGVIDEVIVGRDKLVRACLVRTPRG